MGDLNEDVSNISDFIDENSNPSRSQNLIKSTPLKEVELNNQENQTDDPKQLNDSNFVKFPIFKRAFTRSCWE